MVRDLVFGLGAIAALAMIAGAVMVLAVYWCHDPYGRKGRQSTKQRF